MLKTFKQYKMKTKTTATRNPYLKGKGNSNFGIFKFWCCHVTSLLDEFSLEGNGIAVCHNPCFNLKYQKFFHHFWSEAVHDRRNRMGMKNKQTTDPPVVLEVQGIVSMTRIDMYIYVGYIDHDRSVYRGLFRETTPRIGSLILPSFSPNTREVAGRSCFSSGLCRYT